MADYTTECDHCNKEIDIDISTDIIEDILTETELQCSNCGGTLEYYNSAGTHVLYMCEHCQEEFAQTSYNDGIEEGKLEGYDNGYDTGFDDGKLTGEEEANCEPSPDEVQRIKDLGYEEGYADAQKEFNAS